MFFEFKPDVITLDIEMPKVSGLTFLEKLMIQKPTPALVISSLTEKNSAVALKALELGAVDVIPKPKATNLEEFTVELRNKVKLAARTKVRISEKGLEMTPIKAKERTDFLTSRDPIVAVASSTGGTEALKSFFKQLPEEIPTILVVQHMPPVFTKAFSQTLNQNLPFPVKEAVHGEKIKNGTVYIAPGDFHMEIVKEGILSIGLNKKPPLHSVRPAADILMKSVAPVFGARAIGVILTGMGKDGADGMLHIKKNGGTTFAQDEATSLVFGMPKEAIALGAIDKICPIDKIGHQVLKAFESILKANRSAS